MYLSNSDGSAVDINRTLVAVVELFQLLHMLSRLEDVYIWIYRDKLSYPCVVYRSLASIINSLPTQKLVQLDDV